MYVAMVRHPEPDVESSLYLHHIKKGSVVIEVGSNKGAFTRLLSIAVGLDGKVYALEPNRISYAIMKRYTRGCKNVRPANVGLGSRVAESRGLWAGGPTDKAASSNSPGAHYIQLACEFTTLDNFVRHCNLARLDAMIIDAEGSESEILQGANETLVAYPNANILMEIHHPHTVDEIARLLFKLTGNSYRIEIISKSYDTISCEFSI